MREIWQLISRANKYIDESMPWALAKDPAQKERLNTVLYNLAEVLRIVAILVSPYIPHTSPKIYAQLGLAVAEFSLVDTAWGGLPANTAINKQQPVFPRIDLAEKMAEVAPQLPEPLAPLKEEFSIDDFAKCDLRVAKVLAAEKVKKADKLLKLEVDLGHETRTVISGIALHYQPEELVGKHVVMVINLKAAKIRGVESRGMILAASDDQGNLQVVEVPGMKIGSLVK